jgi:tellurite resistance protein
MVQLTSKAVVTIRDLLRERGSRSSVRPGETADPPEAESQQIIESYGPLCDAMFAMMAADGELEISELEVILGGLRELDERVRASHVERMLARSADRLEKQGQIDFLHAIGVALEDDPIRGRTAFLLAAAVAYADDEIAEVEREVLDQLAQALGIDDAEAAALLDDLDA